MRELALERPGEVDDAGLLRALLDDLVLQHPSDEKAAGLAVAGAGEEPDGFLLTKLERQMRGVHQDLVVVVGVSELHVRHSLMVTDLPLFAKSQVQT